MDVPKMRSNPYQLDRAMGTLSSSAASTKMGKRHSAQSDTVAIVRSQPQQAFPNSSFTVSLHLAQLDFMWRHHEKLFGGVRGAGMASLWQCSGAPTVRKGDGIDPRGPGLPPRPLWDPLEAVAFAIFEQ